MKASSRRLTPPAPTYPAPSLLASKQLTYAGLWFFGALVGEYKVLTILHALSRRYFHRPLDPKKLVEVQFSALKRNERMKDVIKRNALPQVNFTSRLQGWKNRVIGAV